MSEDQAKLIRFSSVAAINEAEEIADEVCVNNNNPTCSQYVSYVRRSMNILFLLVGTFHGSIGVGSHGDDESIINGAVRRSVELNSTISIEDIFTLGGYKFDFVESIIVPETLGKRGNERSAKQQTVVRGLVDKEDGTPSDIAVNDFGNGEFDLQFADFDTSSAAGENGTDLHKRYDGSGIKVPFTTRKASKLTRAHQKDVSAAIARSWGQFATTRSYHMNDYFGLVKTEHEANFYFRIIPELKGFGLNYESVNACGGMAKYL